MKNILFALSFLLVTFIAHSQRTSKAEMPSFYVFDTDWKGTTIDKAVYLLAETKESDSSWRYDYYNLYGPLIKVQHFGYKNSDIPHGEFLFYNKAGTIDSIQFYTNGFPDKSWFYMNDTGKVYLRKDYVQGKLMKTVDYPDKKEQTDEPPKATIVEVESEFNGGQNGWRRFMSRNFRYPDRALNRKMEGTVIVLFEIDKEGLVKSLKIDKSVEYSMDAETRRIIQISPTWTPATQNGKPVRSFKKQPITFRLN